MSYIDFKLANLFQDGRRLVERDVNGVKDASKGWGACERDLFEFERRSKTRL